MGVQLFSEGVRKLWNGWEVRVLVVISLFLQIALIIFGSRRKSTRRISIRCIVWLAYLSADWVATVSLGNLATSEGDSEKNSSKQNNRLLQSFWAPFLLLHLGGPDTITAYSLEDNELWLRHLLGLVVEVVVAIYIFIWSWSKTAITFIAVPIFVSGCIKYGERTYVLWSASTKQFKEELISNNSFAENAMRFAMGKKEEYLFERCLPMEESREKPHEEELSQNQDGYHMYEAYFLFERFKYLFANLVLGLKERTDCYTIIDKKSPKAAFELVAIELGYMYDLLYTKAALTYTPVGILLRTITLSSSVLALVFFSFFVNIHISSPTDIWITYLLLIGAVLLEVYAFIFLLSSDWTELWLEKLQIREINSILATMRQLIQFVLPPNKMGRWSLSVAQYNLISYCLKETNDLFIGAQKLPYISKLLGEYQYLTWEEVDGNMQELIFNQLKQKGEGIKSKYTIKSCKELLAHRGDHVLGKERIEDHDLTWSIVDVEFDHSLLIWHMATDACYANVLVTDAENPPPEHEKCKECTNCKKYREVSQYLSNYMLYLLVLCPSMLPKGIGEIRYRDTCKHVMTCSQKEKDKEDRKGVCEMLLNWIGGRPTNQSSDTNQSVSSDTNQSVSSDRDMRAKLSDYPISKLELQQKHRKETWEMLLKRISRRPINQSVLSDGRKLARVLLLVDDCEKKWKIISEVWIEMLAYVANQCPWKEHAQQLRRGGELLTHVSVLMAHLGLNEQYNEMERIYVV